VSQRHPASTQPAGAAKGRELPAPDLAVVDNDPQPWRQARRSGRRDPHRTGAARIAESPDRGPRRAAVAAEV